MAGPSGATAHVLRLHHLHPRGGEYEQRLRPGPHTGGYSVPRLAQGTLKKLGQFEPLLG